MLEKELANLKPITPARARDFAYMNIRTIKDLLYDFPLRYDSDKKGTDIGSLEPKQKTTIRGTVTDVSSEVADAGHHMIITTATISDDTGSIQAMWLHKGGFSETLEKGMVLAITGKTEEKDGVLAMVNPAHNILKKTSTTTSRAILPIYRLTGGLTQKVRRTLAEKYLPALSEVEEWLPEQIQEAESLLPLADAITSVHFPDTMEHQSQGMERIKFDEFFLHQILYSKSRREIQKVKAPVIKTDSKAVQEAEKQLPFDLSSAQKKALTAILKDLGKSHPMNRLLEGDVGTGKTVVAALAAVQVAAAKWQTAILAPTEILADQHAMSLHELLGKQMRVAVYTRTIRRIGDRTVTKPEMLEAIMNGDVDLVVGTHALLSENVVFNQLGLIVVDEQQRFGVKQRQSLKDRKGDEDGLPHLLSMTATPIPRSLALVLYGDLDRSLLDEYPEERQVIPTSIVTKQNQKTIFDSIKKEMDAKRQIFVVCPIIEESDALGANSVQRTYKEFSKGPFKNYRIEMLHGKMKSDEKTHIMAEFVAGNIDMLVSTTVIEVGVDVPNATVMYVEGAERFGLAQLHQLRGRVGRGKDKGYCYLHPSGELNGLTKERLQAVVNSQNGFELAEKDLAIRGPGNIFGTDQSGFEQFKYGTYADIDLITKARDWAKDYLDEDPELKKWPKLRSRLEQYVHEIHFE